MKNSKWELIANFLVSKSKPQLYFSVFIDALLIIISWHAAYLFRMGFDRWQPARPWYDDMVLYSILIIYLITFEIFGMYRRPLNLVRMPTVAKIFSIQIVGGILIGAIIINLNLSAIARSVLVLHPIFNIILLCFWRIIARILYDYIHLERTGGLLHSKKKIILLGAGENTHKFLKENMLNQGWEVLEIYDDHIPVKEIKEYWSGEIKNFKQFLNSSKIYESDYVVITTSSNTKELIKIITNIKSSGKPLIKY